MDRGLRVSTSQTPSSLPLLVDALDHEPVELEFADDDGGKVNPTAAHLIERHRLGRPDARAQACCVGQGLPGQQHAGTSGLSGGGSRTAA